MPENPDGTYTDQYGNVWSQQNGQWVPTTVAPPPTQTPGSTSGLNYQDQRGNQFVQDPLGGGFAPPDDDISHTIYFDPAQQVNAPPDDPAAVIKKDDPVPTQGGGGGTMQPMARAGANLGSLLQPFNQPGPTYQPAVAPDVTGAGAPPAFPHIPMFNEPTGDQVRGTLGYQFGLDQGRGTLEASAAAKGTLNTGGTLEDVLKYGQNYADQRYQQFRQNSYDDYMTNTYLQYLAPYQAASSNWNTIYPTQANFGLANAAGKNSQDFNKWTQDYNIWRNRNTDTFNNLYDVAKLGSGVQ